MIRKIKQLNKNNMKQIKQQKKAYFFKNNKIKLINKLTYKIRINLIVNKKIIILYKNIFKTNKKFKVFSINFR